MLRSVALDTLRVLAVTGDDRAAVLQGQLTQDVTTASAEATVLTGWADPKGRLLFAGHLFVVRLAMEDALALLVPAELADALLKRLRLYILRAKAQVRLLDAPVTGLLGTPHATGHSRWIKLAVEGERHILVGPADAARADTVAGTYSDWQLGDVRAGVPSILAATTGEFVPQMVNLDLLGGISFSKGCYTGQEIVARMKYLGRVKRRMLRFEAETAAPAPGATLHASRGVVGKVVLSAPAPAAAAGSEFLAVVTLDDLPGPFFLDAARTLPVNRLELPYAISTA